jgi:hypothetical protein
MSLNWKNVLLCALTIVLPWLMIMSVSFLCWRNILKGPICCHAIVLFVSRFNWMVLCHSELLPILMFWVRYWIETTKMHFILCQSEIEFFLNHTRYIEIFCYGTGLATLIPLCHSELKSWKRWLLMYIVQGVEERFVKVTTLTVMKKV